MTQYPPLHRSSKGPSAAAKIDPADFPLLLSPPLCNFCNLRCNYFLSSGPFFPRHKPKIFPLCQPMPGDCAKKLDKLAVIWYTTSSFQKSNKSYKSAHTLFRRRKSDPSSSGSPPWRRGPVVPFSSADPCKDSTLCPFLKTMEVQVSCLKEARKPLQI